MKSTAIFWATSLLLSDYVLDLFFGPEDRGSMFLRNVTGLLQDYTLSHPGKNIAFQEAL
jgi:hypothetical protein